MCGSVSSRCLTRFARAVLIPRQSQWQMASAVCRRKPNEGPARLDGFLTAPIDNVRALLFREALVLPMHSIPTSRLAKERAIA